MGSFNDLVIHPLNGHPVEESQAGNINRTLDVLSGRGYDLSWLYQETQNGAMR